MADGPDNIFTGRPGTVFSDVVVPGSTTYARFSLFNEFVSGSGNDLDLYVFRCSDASCATTTLVGASAGGTAAEEVNLLNPTAATYRVWVHGFAVNPSPANFTLFTWVLGSTGNPNMTVTAPTSATTGATENILLQFSGLSPATKYLGSVAYSGITGLPNPTIVRVDMPLRERQLGVELRGPPVSLRAGFMLYWRRTMLLKKLVRPEVGTVAFGLWAIVALSYAKQGRPNSSIPQPLLS